MAEFKMNVEICGKIIAELNKASSIELVQIGTARNTKKVPENLFSFIKYRAGTILETRADRHDARRAVENAIAHRKMVRAARALGAAVPEIMEEKFFLSLLNAFRI